MPLGQFSKALKNVSYQTPGHHPTKSHLHPLNPTSHTDIDWNKRQKKADKPKIPGWFNDTKQVRKQIGKEWDRAEGIQHPKSAVPFKKKADAGFSTLFTPFYHHPDTNEKVYGKPGQNIMQHILKSMLLDGQKLSTPEIWALDPEIGKEVIDSGS
jgi:hypothetical protein